MRRTIDHSVRISIVVFLSLGALAVQAQTVWRVDNNAPNDPGPDDPAIGDPNEDGSAEHPFDAIQEGIDAAFDGDEVRVASGVYFGDGNRDLDFLGKSIVVQSEYGSESTFIDCGFGGRAVHFQNGETAAATFQGFTIRYGHDYYEGGALHCRLSSPTIVDCIFEDCTAGQGGAVDVGSGSPTFIGCCFKNNSASEQGGAVCVLGGSPVFEWCTFFSNRTDRSSSGYGGAIYYYGGGAGTISDCVFLDNTAYRSGGAMCVWGPDPEILRCHFEGNSADTGGALYLVLTNAVVTESVFLRNQAVGSAGAIYTFESDPTFVSCLFEGNTAHDGGALRTYEGTPALVSCDFRENTAEQLGGAILIEGSDHQSQILSGCTFLRNKAVRGGALYSSFGEPLIAQCRFYGNEAKSGGGGGVHTSQSEITVMNSLFVGNLAAATGGGLNLNGLDTVISNCVFAFNSATRGGGFRLTSENQRVQNCILWGNDANLGPQFSLEYEAIALVTHSVVEGGEAAVYVDDSTLMWGDFSLDVDPLLVQEPSDGGDGWGDDPNTPSIDEGSNDDYGDLRIQASSPCVNAGSEEAVDLGLLDVAGSDRVQSCRVDIGAHESEHWPPFEDCNGNGVEDDCDVSDAVSVDCNRNHVPDECDLDSGQSADCNQNGTLDECDLANGASLDCNQNAVPDDCELEDNDCNANGRPDECDFADGGTDCNTNGLLDECDIASGASIDINGNGLPDECECVGDISGDLQVNVVDLNVFLAYYGNSGIPPWQGGDLDGDGSAGLSDLAILLAVYGTVCE